MVFLMDWSTLTDGRVHSSDPSSEGADYFGWLLAVTGIGRTEWWSPCGCRGVPDKCHVPFNRFLIRVPWTHAPPGFPFFFYKRLPFQRAVNASWNIFLSIRGATFFPQLCSYTELNLSKFVRHLYQADCRIFFFLSFYTSFIFSSLYISLGRMQLIWSTFYSSAIQLEHILFSKKNNQDIYSV